MFETQEMKNMELTNIERFEILRKQSEERGNIKYSEMFGDIIDRHEAVFEALDEHIRARDERGEDL